MYRNALRISGLVRRPVPALGAALLALIPQTASAQCQSDSYEPNDTCATATQLPLPTGGTTYFASASGADSSTGVNRDFYQVTLPPGERLRVTLEFFDLDVARIWVWGDNQCTQLEGTTEHDVTQIFDNTGTLPKDYWIEIGPTPGGPTFNCLDYRLVLYRHINVCPSQVPDTFEPNDSEASALLLPPGLHPLTLNLPADLADHFLIPVQPGQLLTMQLTTTSISPGLGYIFHELYDVSGQQSVTGFDGDGAVSVVNTTGQPFLGLRVALSGQEEICAEYTVEYSVSDTPCIGLLPDAFEPNQDCFTSPLLTPGYYPNLNAWFQDGDFYEILLQPGESMLLDVTWPLPDPTSDVTLFVYDHCDGSSSNNHQVVEKTPGRARCVARNENAAPMSLTLQIGPAPGHPEAPCVEYDIDLRVCPDGSMGPSYCAALPNSTGETGKLYAIGSSVVADNEFTLLVNDLPTSKPGILFYGPNQVALPLGNGLLCAGGQTRRLPPVLITHGLFGSVSREVDLTTAPASLDLLPGTTWNFQFWHRDQGSFNFSDAVSITFQ